MKNKFRSYGFWTALAGAVVVLVQALGKCFGFSVDDQVVSGVIMAIAGVLVVLGVVTMPNDKGSQQGGEDETEPTQDQTDKTDEK